MLNDYFADMHIHIGQDIKGGPVKITASNKLTVTNILKEASRRKGIQLIGVIDSQSPYVQEELYNLIQANQAKELVDGGIQFENVTLILGAEIEVYDDNCHGPIHVLCYLPTLEKMAQFSEWLSERMRNITLSSQRYYGSAKDLQYKVKQLSGLFIPAHVFTPFKSLYGKGVKLSLTEVFDADLIDGIELGLSSDTSMARAISELSAYTFLTNSDAHSLPKIGREYQLITMKKPSFQEFEWALHGVEGRSVKANYGMSPKLGKYYTTVCHDCMKSVSFNDVVCPHCQSSQIVKGVYDRIQELKSESLDQTNRPPYVHQVPLEYIPKLGPKTLEKLLAEFQTEMNVIHHVSQADLEQVVSKNIANYIIQMRHGEQQIEAGGGGTYGRII